MGAYFRSPQPPRASPQPRAPPPEPDDARPRDGSSEATLEEGPAPGDGGVDIRLGGTVGQCRWRPGGRAAPPLLRLQRMGTSCARCGLPRSRDVSAVQHHQTAAFHQAVCFSEHSSRTQRFVRQQVWEHTCWPHDFCHGCAASTMTLSVRRPPAARRPVRGVRGAAEGQVRDHLRPALLPAAQGPRHRAAAPAAGPLPAGHPGAPPPAAPPARPRRPPTPAGAQQFFSPCTCPQNSRPFAVGPQQRNDWYALPGHDPEQQRLSSVQQHRIAKQPHSVLDTASCVSQHYVSLPPPLQPPTLQPSGPALNSPPRPTYTRPGPANSR